MYVNGVLYNFIFGYYMIGNLWGGFVDFIFKSEYFFCIGDLISFIMILLFFIYNVGW